MKLRKARTVLPYITTAVVDSWAPGGSSRNGMNLSGKAGHRAADADAADVRAAADAVHPAALADVALHDRPPAAELDDALGRAGLLRSGEVGLLVVAAAVAALVNRAAEQPGRPQVACRAESSARGRPPG